VSFTGFPVAALDFYDDLEMDNTKSYWEAHKAVWTESVKAPMTALVTDLEAEFGSAKVFRPYRDVRFAKDKTPYKTNVAARFPWIGEAGEPEGGAHTNGGYLSIQPGQHYQGGGLWMADRERLQAFRQAIIDDPGRVRRALEDPGFVAVFGSVATHESLKRTPPGWPPDHQLADMFRWKDIVFGRDLTDDEIFDPGLPDLLADGYAAAMPVFRFLATLRP
jgi:uncharacterized protein (TIGR02453 family)